MAAYPSNAMTFPTTESRLMIWNDRTNLEGLLLQGIAYGVHLVVFVCTLQGLFFCRRFNVSTGKACFLAAYTLFMFMIGTFMVGANAQVCVSMFVDNRDFIAGPSAWIAANFSITANTFGDIAYILGNFAADALLLYRTLVVWNKNVYVLVGPLLLFLASTVFSILVAYETVQPSASLWTTVSANFTLVSFSLAIPLNVILTALIVIRLWRMSRQVKHILGDSHARAYTSLAAIMAESAGPYSICGLIFIATFAANSPGQNLFLPVLGQVMCISPELIIWRVAAGCAWSEQTTGVSIQKNSSRSVDEPDLDVKSSSGGSQV